MKKILCKKLFILLILISLVFFIAGGTTEEPVAEEKLQTFLSGVITLADISSEPVKKIKRFQPLADYLASNLSEFGIGSGNTKIAANMETVAGWLSSGDVDLYFDSLYPAMMVSDLSGASPIMRRWKRGVSEYHSVIFARSDRNINVLSDLFGKMIAFEDPNSTSGYMLPLSYLIEKGMNPIEKNNSVQPVLEDEIAYIFAGEDQNVVQWVLNDRISAGVLDNESFNELPEETLSNLVILGETEKVVRQVVVARSDMDPDMLQKIKKLLLDLDKTEKGPAILKTFKTSQFDEFPGGEASALTKMWEIYRLVLDGRKDGS